MNTKALISCAQTVQLICVFVFAYAKCSFLILYAVNFINIKIAKKLIMIILITHWKHAVNQCLVLLIRVYVSYLICVLDLPFTTHTKIHIILHHLIEIWLNIQFEEQTLLVWLWIQVLWTLSSLEILTLTKKNRLGNLQNYVSNIIFRNLSLTNELYRVLILYYKFNNG